MCNRVRAPEMRDIKIRWNLFNDLPGFKPGYNIGPDRGAIVAILRHEAGNEARLMDWPLIPSFARTVPLEYSTSNAAAERLLQSPVYNRLVDQRRCLIPVAGFYEWQGSKPPKTPFYIYLKSAEPFALAGLWDTWRKPDGSVLESFSIITTEANDFMGRIHHRMPLILHKDDERAWLDCAANPFDNVESLVQPFPAELMATHEISKRINNPNYDAPDCSAPVED